MTRKSYAQFAWDEMEKIERIDGCPATLEGAIRHVMLKNPLMVRWRTGALDLLYCILGTGIDWHEGRLHDNNSNNYLNMPAGVGGQGCWSRDFGMTEAFGSMGVLPDMQKMVRERHARDFAKIMEVLDNVDSRCQEYDPSPRWYPISWYGCRLCAPEGAQQDFRDGALETLKLILSQEPQRGTKQWLEHQRTKAYAEEILIVLEAADE